MSAVPETEAFRLGVAAAVKVAGISWQHAAYAVAASIFVPYDEIRDEAARQRVKGMLDDFLGHWIECQEPKDWIPEQCRREAYGLPRKENETPHAAPK